MTIDIKYEEDQALFTATKVGHTIMLTLKDNLLLHATDIMAKGMIFKYLDSISESDEIKVIVLFSCPGKKGRQEYLEFYNKIFDSSLERSALMRMCNAINQFILKIVCSDKFYIHVNSGQVITTFLSFSLACDYRIVADTTVYQNPCLELGLVPKGGGAFFCPKCWGRAKPMKSCCPVMTCPPAPPWKWGW